MVAINPQVGVPLEQVTLERLGLPGDGTLVSSAGNTAGARINVASRYTGRCDDCDSTLAHNARSHHGLNHSRRMHGGSACEGDHGTHRDPREDVLSGGSDLFEVTKEPVMSAIGRHWRRGRTALPYSRQQRARATS